MFEREIVLLKERLTGGLGVMLCPAACYSSTFVGNISNVCSRIEKSAASERPSCILLDQLPLNNRSAPSLVRQVVHVCLTDEDVIAGDSFMSCLPIYRPPRRVTSRSLSWSYVRRR